MGVALQGLTGGSLGVDGQRELVHHHNQQQDDGRESGADGDEPTIDGTPLKRLGDGSGLTVGGSLALSGRAVNELAARAINAVLGVVLECLNDTNVDEESDDHGDQDQSAEHNGDHTGQGHADGEDELVADTVEEECEQDHHQDEATDQSDQNESLGGLGDVTERAVQWVVLELAASDGSLKSNHSLHAVQVIENLGGVDLVVVSGQSWGRS